MFKLALVSYLRPSQLEAPRIVREERTVDKPRVRSSSGRTSHSDSERAVKLFRAAACVSICELRDVHVFGRVATIQ